MFTPAMMTWWTEGAGKSPPPWHTVFVESRPQTDHIFAGCHLLSVRRNLLYFACRIFFSPGAVHRREAFQCGWHHQPGDYLGFRGGMLLWSISVNSIVGEHVALVSELRTIVVGTCL